MLIVRMGYFVVNPGKEKTEMIEAAKDSLDVGILVSDIKAGLNFIETFWG